MCVHKCAHSIEPTRNTCAHEILCILFRYRPGLDPDAVQEVVIASKTTQEIDVVVTEAGSRLRWHFQTAAYDISFGVIRKSDGGGAQEIVKQARVNADLCPQRGELEVYEPGTYSLVFDNSFSR